MKEANSVPAQAFPRPQSATRRRTKIFLKYWLPVTFWAYLIFYSSSVPGEDITPLFTYQDVVYHFVAYLIFAWLLKRALRYSFVGLSSFRQIYLTVIISLIYALSDEFHQSFVPQRNVSLMDLSIDGIGLLLGAIIYRWQK